MSATNADQSAALFTEYHDRLHRFARQLVGTSSDADDLVQAAFLKAHCYLGKGKTIRAPLSFLVVTVRNLVIDGYHQKKTRRVDSTVEVDEVAPEGEGLSAERQVMSAQEFEHLCVAIGQLPKRMREAFVLRKVYGYSCREIAEHTGRSVNTVREQVAQGFKKLQALRNPPEESPKEKPKKLNGHARRASQAPGVVRTATLRNSSEEGSADEPKKLNGHASEVNCVTRIAEARRVRIPQEESPEKKPKIVNGHAPRAGRPPGIAQAHKS